MISIFKQLKKKRLYPAAFLLFVAFSFLFISPIAKKTRSTFHSSELKKQATLSEKIERIDYVDDNGHITIAADLGYATIIIEKTDHTCLEQYYDEKGAPISRYNGYYALLREYDEKGNNVRIAYLDRDGQPMIMANGYAIEERKYNENRQVVEVRYYDITGHPIQTSLYGYGAIHKYNQENKTEITTYIDDLGNPMITGQGYACVKYSYYSDGAEKGKIQSEMYFDAVGNPVELALGQYGVYKEYDDKGRISSLTYLGAFGEPVVTNKGYTTIKKTYHTDNSTATEFYYDVEGNPYGLSEGQYGIKKENGQSTYLNKNGNELFSIRTILYNNSWLVIILSIIVIILSSMMEKKWNYLFFTLYICIIIYLTLMYRDSGEFKKTFSLWSYRRFFTSSEERADIVKNIWLFIPLGAILFRLYPKKTVLILPIGISVLIEGIQYITRTGFCELDDILSNTIGGVVGYLVAKLTIDFVLRIKSCRNIHTL